MVMIQRPGTAALAPQLSLRSWVAAGLCVLAAGAAICTLFPREVAAAVRVWLESTAYNHCFLIIPVAIYLAWNRRYVLHQTAPQPDLRFLVLLLPLIGIWLATAMASVMELQQLTVVTMYQVIALAVLGWRAYRAMLLPFLYLYFLVPVGNELVPSLQNVTAWFTIQGLRLVGIPVYSDGMLIEVPAGNFVIAEACAGLRFLIASIAFGVFFAAIMFRSRIRWLIFIALCVVVPIIANGIRAFGIIAIAEALNNAAAVEADHIIYGWVFFTFVTLLLIFIGMSFADDRTEGRAAPEPPCPVGMTRPSSFALATIIGLVVAAIGPAYAGYRDWRAVTVNFVNVTPPLVASPWMPVDADRLEWRPLIQDPDREFLRTFVDDGRTVTQYVALYEAKGFHNNLVRGTNDIADPRNWQSTGTGEARVTIDGREATIATNSLTGVGHRARVWDFYVVNGKVVASPMKAKLAQLFGLFGHSEDVAAFVAIATEETGNTAASIETLQTFLSAMEPMPRYLESRAAQ